MRQARLHAHRSTQSGLRGADGDALAEIAAEMAGMLAHDRALPDGCKACAMQKRLADLGVVV